MSHFSWGCWTFWTSLKHGIWWRKSIPNVWVMWKIRTWNPTPDMTDRIEPEEMDALVAPLTFCKLTQCAKHHHGYCLPSGSDCYIAIENGDLVRGFTNWTWWCSIVFCKRLPEGNGPSWSVPLYNLPFWLYYWAVLLFLKQPVPRIARNCELNRNIHAWFSRS